MAKVWIQSYRTVKWILLLDIEMEEITDADRRIKGLQIWDQKIKQ